ncbi:hypothetical protein TL16_g01437 [Triparma laevis f. inornata]|uniref:Uncharacterized protein n=1 Tax=Triparma laevis f. inornata TaxID=1714386 RepID=A0A9W7DRB5_9STRA|nr:hypothetical protein TL16_g01437 [Triparma laevis f. inornata]
MPPNLPLKIPDPRLSEFFTEAQWIEKVTKANRLHAESFRRILNVIFLIIFGGEILDSLLRYGAEVDPELLEILDIILAPIWVLCIVWWWQTMKSGEEQIKGLFKDPQGRYEFHYFRGQKHSPMRAGFKLSRIAIQMTQQGTVGAAPIAQTMAMGMMQPMYDPATGKPLQPVGMPMFDPQTGQMLQQGGGGGGFMQMGGAQVSPGGTRAPVAVAAPVPTREEVTVRVPIYGGGGSVNVEYNGNLINVEIPADAKAGADIVVEVPDMYKKSKGSGVRH